MYDRFDSPGGGEEQEEEYSENPLEEARNSAANIVEQAKPYAPFIIAGVAALIVLFFAYDFFIGSYRTVEFELTDTEGKPIDGTIKISSPEGSEIKSIRTGETIGLRHGDYRIDVSSTGKRTVRAMPITVNKAGPVNVELESAKELELSGTMPEIFFTGEEKELKITITNNSNEDEEVKIILEGDMKEIMQADATEPLIVAPGENVLDMKIKVDKEVENKQTGKNKSGVIRIEGLDNKNAKIEGKYALIEFEADKLKVSFGSSSTKADYGKIKIGGTIDKTLKITNNNEFDVTNAKVEVKITNTEFSDPVEVQNWFKFSPENFLNITADGESQITVILIVPASVQFPAGKSSESITGALYARTGYFEKKFDISLDIEKVEAKILISGINENYTIRKTDNAYKKEFGLLEVRNSGEVLLADIEARINCQNQGTSWLSFNGTLEYSIPQALEESKVERIPYLIDVPSDAAPGQITLCKIGVFYTDPSSQRKQLEKPIIIRTE